MTVAVRLPPDAHRNSFDIVIARKGADTALATQTLVWDRAAPFGDMTLTFSPADIAAAGGSGRYEAQFHANGQDVMSRNFRITDPR